MPRDGGGTYVLPAGNPVVDGTIIESVWANTTLSDIAIQLNNVLTRDGILGPVLPMRFPDGNPSSPSITFAAQPTLGLYRRPGGSVAFASAGNDLVRIGAAQAEFLVPVNFLGGVTGINTAQPDGFAVCRTAPTHQAIGTGTTQITLNNVLFNNGAGTWNGTGYTVKKAGLYQANFCITAQRSAQTTGWMYFIGALRVNGTVQLTGSINSVLAGTSAAPLFAASSGSGVLQLNEGDVVSIQIETSVGCELLAGSQSRSTGFSLVEAATTVIVDGGSGSANLGPRVVVLGDSLSAAQVACTNPWPERWAAAMRNCGAPIDLINLATSGWTFNKANTDTTLFDGATMVGRAIALKPDVVFVALGFNDAVLSVEGRTLGQIQSDATSTLAALRAGLPDAVIIAIEEYAHDSTNFPNPGTTLKNKGIIQNLFTRPSSGILLDSWSSEILETAVDTTQRQRYGNWANLRSTIAASSSINGVFRIDFWKAARLGLTGIDGLHLTDAAAQFAAAYTLKASQNLPALTAVWPIINKSTFGLWSDPDLVFSGLLTQSGDGWTINADTYGSDFVSKHDQWFEHRLEHWWARSGATVRIGTTSVAQNGLFYWSVANARPRQACAVSVDDGAFGASIGVTDQYGAGLFMGASSLAVGTRTLRYKVGDEVFGPFTLTVTAPTGGAVVSTAISDSTPVGRAVLTAADAAAARSAIGAGTSSLVLGTTAGTAKAGDYVPTWSDVTGKPAVIAAGVTAADARTAIGAGTSSLVLGTTAGTAKAGDWRPAVSDINATGTPGGGNFLRGDGAWAVPPGGGGGGGDVTGPGAAVTADALVAWSGTTGQSIKQVTFSGLVKLAAGVPTAATAGTDYATPAQVALKANDSAVVKLTGAQTVAGVKTFSSRSKHAGAYTEALTPAHSATPTFDCATSNVFEPATMTGNITSITLTNATVGQTVQIRFQQDATGGRTCAVPSGAKIDGSINTGANRVSWLVMTYSSRGARWEGNWLQVPA
ncbi:MAG: SGNH/GDSL hydrolase family protein [Desulfurellales bacterium]|nr:MAG: SGNH/GDSL hydrolase family protein [Desulfurellales bacterium]